MPDSAPKTTPKVFELIKSLDTPEITYFKKHVQRKADKEPIYMVVFNKMLNMKTYNEQKLVKKLDITISNLRTINSQLYDRIMDKLHEFHLENSIEERVKKDIHFIHILLEKNLKDHVYKILNRIRTTIAQYELFERLPDLLKIEQLIWDKNWYKDTHESDIRALHDRTVEGLEQQKNLSLYLMYRCIAQKAHFDKIRLDEDIKFIPNEAFESPEQATSLRAKIEYYRVLATYYFMTGAVSTAFEYNQKSLEIYEENIKLIESFPEDYIDALNRYLTDCQNLGKHEELNKVIEKIEQLSEQNAFRKVSSLNVKAFVILYRLKFNQIISNEDFVVGLELIEEFKDLFKRHGQEIPINPQITFRYMVAYILFANEQYDESLIWLRGITQKRPGIAEEIYLFALSLELVAHYECGHKHLDSLIINVQSQIKSVRGKLYESEKQLFALLRELHNAPHAERKDIFRKYLPIIKALKQNPDEARFFGHFDLLRWVQGKLDD